MFKKRAYQLGFTLIEMLVVLAIIAVLALIAMPSPEPIYARRQVVESLALIDDYKKLIEFYHKSTQVFLVDNKEAGIPAPDKILGNYIEKIALEQGAFQLYFGNKAHPDLMGKVLSVRPLMVKGSPESPISWACGLAAVPEGMVAVGKNNTSVAAKYLPVECRI